MKFARSLASKLNPVTFVPILGSLLLLFGAAPTVGQTVFLDFNTTGQYTNNFNPWNDNGAGVDASNYCFSENPTAGVGGGPGVGIFQNTDTTATYKSGSWNFSTNGATITFSVLLNANAQTGRSQYGIINTNHNGLNNNTNVAFETYRIFPTAAGVWSIREQYRSSNAAPVETTLGSVNVTAGRWYKFVVGLTNTGGGGLGNYSANCALYDFGANGITPGTNLITFATTQSHTNQTDITTTQAWPALRAAASAAISGWDNFLVYTRNSKPVFTIPLTNSTAFIGGSAPFSVFADGPGTITYAWYTNKLLVSGAAGSNYTAFGVGTGFTNIMVVASNSNGSVTNSAAVSVIANPNTMTPILLTGFNRDVVIESNAVGPPYGSYALEYNPGENTCFYQHGLPGTTYGLPVSGVFTSVVDSTVFQFQPYTTNNALVMSSETGVTTGTLTLVNPGTYNTLAIIANSASASPTSTGTLTLNFADGTTYSTNYNAADWFFNPGFALQGVDRINISSAATGGGPNDPRFYQTTLSLAALLGATNKALASLTFGEAAGAGATAIYGVSGYLGASNTFTLAVITNFPATGVQPNAATLSGQVLSSGGYAPTITLYYGPADGGTNAGSWSNSIPLGLQTGTYTQAISGLSPNTTYYCNASAVNIAGTSWAASRSFTTTSVTLPQVTNAPATAIGATVATLNGQVLSAGGAATTVTLFYGPADGSTNAAAWSNNISVGVQTSAFAQTVGSLGTNTTYYFTARGVNSAGTAWAAPSLSFTTLSNAPTTNFTAVLTYHNDNTRWGLNSNETILTPANVNSNSFGRLFSYTLDGFVYAQPLIMTNVSVLGKGTHNVVYIATEHNSVYAFDADDASGPNASPLWQTSFINPGAGITTVPNGDVGTTDITPEIGVTSTPVIDPLTGTLYCEVKTKEGTTYVHRLHALDIATGLERTNFNSPGLIAATNYPGAGTGDNDGQNPPHVLWNPLREHCRPALTLLNGAIYISYASHGDNQPYHGWMFAFNATNVSQQLSVYNATPNGGLGGFWDGGGGPSVDAQGNLYFQTGNGTFNGDTGVTATNNYAMSVLKLATTNGITMVDYFAPSNAVSLSGSDQDLGSAAPIILPDSAGSTAHPHLVVGGGKTPPIYLIDRDNMGRFNGTTGPDLIVQQFNGGPGGDRDTSPAFFNNTLYTIDSNSKIGAYTIANAVFNTTPVESPDTYGNKGGATACVSANGTNNGIVWAIYNSGGQSPATPCVLRAYNATNLTQKLYASDQVTGRDTAPNAVKFTTPTIANGKVYVGGQYALTVYGIAAAFVNAPLISPNGGVFTNSVTVTLSDTTPGATIYYTLDGTNPTTNSILYTAPFVLTNSVSVTAAAFKPGAVASGPVSASFLNSSAIGTGTGLLGQYWSNTTSTAFTNTGFNAAPSLTRVDPTINFNWSSTPPATNIALTNYVVRWTGSVQPQFSETYTFYTTTDDGTRLWVNGQLLVDKWVDQGPTTWSGQITLVAQQRYTIQMDFYQHGGGSQAQLFWSSPSSGPMTIIPQTQLYPVTNPPPSVVLTAPGDGASYTAAATVTISANAAAQYNRLDKVDFYAGATLLGTVSNAPYTLTTTGVAAGSYTLTARAQDGSGLLATSAPVNITVTAASGQPYGLTSRQAAPAFYSMPTTIPVTPPGSLPLLLSQTGVFSNTPSMTPTNSLVPYQPNVPLWSDGAVKTRWVSVPNFAAPYTPDEQIAFAPTGTWSFPAGTVFVKTFQLQTNQSDPSALRRLETRLLVRDINGAVYGVTYKWRPDYSDADLLTTSSNENIAITTPGGVVTQTWYYPSPADCLQCHTPQANYVLGLNTRQLNGNFNYPGGVTDNQLRTMNRLGLFNPAFDEANISSYEQLYSLTNQAAPIETRARSYLDANCAQCHQPGGSGPTFDARFETPLTNQNIINGILAKANLGDPNTRVVVPRDIWRSLLYYRMNTTDSLKMPPLARNLIDTNAVAVMAAWIDSLPGTPALAPPTITPSGGTFVNSVSVSLQSTNVGAIYYYTLDSTLPTTNSFLYSSPFTVSSNVTVTASAFETGYSNSFAAIALFTIRPPVYFTSGGAFSNNAFVMQISGIAGMSYVLQGSTNLTDWSSLSTNTAPANLFNLADPAASGFPLRFYRVFELP